MSKTLTLELPDEIYETMQQAAAQTGLAAEDAARDLLLRHITEIKTAAMPAPDEAERQQARARFERHFGTWEGDEHSGDNDAIDADLARAYANET